MGQLNINGFDAAFANLGKASAKKETKDASGDFKKLLQDNPKSEQEVSNNPKQETPVKPEHQTSTEDTKEEEMLSGVQMAQLLLGIQNIPNEQNEAVPIEETQSAETFVNGVILEETPVTGNESGAEETVGGQAAQELADAQTEEGTQLQGVHSETGRTEEKAEKTKNKSADKDNAADRQSKVLENKEVPQEHLTQQTGHLQQNVKNTVSSNEAHEVPTQKMQVSQSEEIPQKLPNEMLAQISKGVREFEIQIAPEHLGKIAIKVVYEQEQTIVSIARSEKATLNMLGQHAREIGNIMEKNLGTETNIYVEDKPQDYLNQKGNENDHAGREAEQERQREEHSRNQANDSGQFLQKLRLGLVE